MTSRLERAQATVEREERKDDLRRLAQAKDHLQATFAFLKGSFHDHDYETYVDSIRPQIAEYSEQLKRMAAEK